MGASERSARPNDVSRAGRVSSKEENIHEILPSFTSLRRAGGRFTPSEKGLIKGFFPPSFHNGGNTILMQFNLVRKLLPYPQLRYVLRFLCL